MAVEVRQTEFRLADNAYGERRSCVRVEYKCPDCSTWNPLTPAAQVGQEITGCRQLGCTFKTRYDFTPFVEAIARKRLDDGELRR